VLLPTLVCCGLMVGAGLMIAAAAGGAMGLLDAAGK
jgi:hypothetical protein